VIDEDKTLVEVRTGAWQALSPEDEPTLVQEATVELLELASRGPRGTQRRSLAREDLTVVHAQFDPRTPIVREASVGKEAGPDVEGAAAARIQPARARRFTGTKTEPRLRERLIGAPKNLAYATGLGAIVGLAFCGVVVGLVWFLEAGGSSRGSGARSSAEALVSGATHTKGRRGSATEAEIVAWVLTQSGRPVQGARVGPEGAKEITDSEGRALIVSRLESGAARVTSMAVECPAGHVARERERSLKWGQKSEVGLTLRREVTFYCEVETVEVQLELLVRGGDAHFWLGERDLGVSENGSMTRTLRVPSHSEQVLTVEPLPKKGQTRRPKIVGDSPSLRVEETPLTFAHTLELWWPRRMSPKPSLVPYRL